MHSVIDSMFYSGIHAAFKGVSALLGALTPAKGRKRTEGEANARIYYMIQKTVKRVKNPATFNLLNLCNFS